MYVVDTSYLIDYGEGNEDAVEWIQSRSEDVFLLPAPVLSEFLVGLANAETPANVDAILGGLQWCDVVDVGRQTAIRGAELVESFPAYAPDLDGVDAIVAAVADEYDATVVSRDRDLTSEELQSVLDVETY